MKRLCIAALIVSVMTIAPARGDTPKERATRISQNIMSPFCPGVTLHDCPSDAAIALRVKIEGWAADGMNDPAIYSRLESEYDSIRAVPDGGLGVLAWVLPAFGLLAGALIALRLARRWNDPSVDTDRPAIASSDRARLDAEIDALRRGGA